MAKLLRIDRMHSQSLMNYIPMFIAVVKTPPGNLWIMAVLTPLFLLVVVIGMVAFILCQRNRVIFKTGAFRNFKTRSKVRLFN